MKDLKEFTIDSLKVLVEYNSDHNCSIFKTMTLTKILVELERREEEITRLKKQIIKNLGESK
jgi:hypothetical protein